MNDHQTLIINGSARVNSNTEKAISTLSPFSQHEMIKLCELKINPYSYDPVLTANDDFMFVVEKMLASTDIVFATPVYWYAMSGLMKTLFDRMTELIADKKTLGRMLKGKRCFLISCGADDELPDGFVVPFKRTCDYFEMEFVVSFYMKAKN